MIPPIGPGGKTLRGLGAGSWQIQAAIVGLKRARCSLTASRITLSFSHCQHLGVRYGRRESCHRTSDRCDEHPAGGTSGSAEACGEESPAGCKEGRQEGRADEEGRRQESQDVSKEIREESAQEGESQEKEGKESEALRSNDLSSLRRRAPTKNAIAISAMPLDYDKLLNWRPPEVRQKLARKDTILYALGLGLGADPMDERQLRFVYEKDLLALPTIATVLASPAFWMKAPEFGLDWHKILHGEEAFEISTPIPAEGELIGRTRVAAIVDKGADKGALALIERTISEAQTGQTIATVKSTAFMRSYGGFGGPSGPTPELHQLPNRAPDLTCDAPTLPQAALIYRLSGDYNPLHADPEVARQGGFRQPILHGLCSLGIAGHAILKTVCNYNPGRLKSLKLRFSLPVHPGETIRTEIWVDGSSVSFRARVVERDVIVLNNGLAMIE
jgi:acyl dehydratase